MAEAEPKTGSERTPSLEIKPSKASQVRVAAVVAAAMLIAITTILLLAGVTKGISFRRSVIYTYLPDATGLSTESEVRLSGLHIGTVSKVTLSGLLDQQKAVRVDLKVGEEFLRLIPVDSITSISSDTLVGPGFVSIAEGKSLRTLAHQGTLASEPVKLAQDRANQVQALRERLDQIDQIVQEVATPESPIGRFIVGETEYAKVLGKISSFELSVREMVSPTNTVGQAFFSDKMYKDIRRPIANLDTTLAAIRNGEGTAGQLFASDDQYNRFVRQLRDLHQALTEVAAGKGQLGGLIRDDAAHAKALVLLKSTNALLDSLTKGDGTSAQLLRDPRLYEALNGSLRN